MLEYISNHRNFVLAKWATCKIRKVSKLTLLPLTNVSINMVSTRINLFDLVSFLVVLVLVFTSVWISLFDIFDPQVLIVKLLSCNFGCNSLVVPSIKVLKLKWIRQSLRQSLPSQTYLLLTTHRDIVLLNRFQLSEPHASSLIDVFSSVALFATAAREAEAYRLSFSVIFWKNCF